MKKSATPEEKDELEAVGGSAEQAARGLASLGHGNLTENVTTIFVCGRRESRPACATCGMRSVSLCDFALGGSLKGKTCDRPMCAGCRRPQPQLGPNKDYCRVHDELARAKAAKGG